MDRPSNRLAAFERIFVINLAHRTDRRQQMEAQLAAVGVPLDSSQLTFFPAVRPDDLRGFPSLGARGCYLSHLGVLRAAAGLRNVLILEDDLDFVDDFELPPLPSGWGMFYGGARHALVPTGPLTTAAPSEPVECAHFLGLNGAVIAPLIGYLEAILMRPTGHPDGGPMHVDGAYSRFRADHPAIVTLVATPDLGFQRPSRSDIHPLRWFDRVPVVREVVQFTRMRRAARG